MLRGYYKAVYMHGDIKCTVLVLITWKDLSQWSQLLQTEALLLISVVFQTQFFLNVSSDYSCSIACRKLTCDVYTCDA